MEWHKITVVLLVIGVSKCACMAVSEIEEFRNFLKKTSHLEETLKKGPGVDHADDSDAVSDHAWEDSGKFEGDIILNERQRKVIVQEVAEGLSRNGLLDTTKRWPDNEVIFYIQREHFTSDQVQAIEDGIADLAQASCIKFRPYKKGDRDAVVIQGSRRGCFSQVGYQGGYQVLNLSGRHPVGRGCFRHGTVVHELLHTLGFYHMQSSPDRDDYIDVLWENIVEPAKHNFRKYNTFSVSDFGVGYDYDSVLHYSRRAFSRNGRDTLVPKQGGASIGQRTGLSDKDTQKLNKMYCDAGSDDSVVKDEQSTQKTVSQRPQTEKPKHFEGHGIGYHQGKTVVIKLTPSAAKTYNLVPEFPTFHMFDYFSKAPEILSPKFDEENQTGKGIEYSYDPPQILDSILLTKDQDESDSGEQHNFEDENTENENSKSSDQQDRDDPVGYSIEDHDQYLKDEQTSSTPNSGNPAAIEHENGPYNTNDNYDDAKQIPEKDNDENLSEKTKKEDDNSNEKQENIQNSKNDEASDITPEDIDFDFNEAFERLGKIIKTHVYPSQTPNFDIYKGIGYQDKKKPKYFNSDSDSEIDKLEKDLKKLNISSILPPKDSKHFYVLNDKLPRQFTQLYDAAAKIKQVEETKNGSHTNDKLVNASDPINPISHVIQEREDSFESSYPYSDEYEDSHDKIDYSFRNNPYEHYNSPSKDTKKTGKLLNGEHSIVGYVVPQDTEDSYEDDEYPYDTYRPPDYRYGSSRIAQDAERQHRDHIKQSKQAFKIIGLLVPIPISDKHKERINN